MSFLLAAVGAIGTLLLSDKAEYDKGKESGTKLLDMFETIGGMKCGDHQLKSCLVSKIDKRVHIQENVLSPITAAIQIPRTCTVTCHIKLLQDKFQMTFSCRVGKFLLQYRK